MRRCDGFSGQEPRRRLAEPLDDIEVDGGRAIHLEMTELDAVDRADAELLDPSQERIGDPSDDEQDPRRSAGGNLRHRIETSNGVGVLETPGVGIHHPEEESLVSREVERDQHQRALGVEPDEVDRSMPEQQPRIHDLQARLDALDILGNQLLQVADVLDLKLPERGSHRHLPWLLGCEPRLGIKQTGDQGYPPE
ncbi:MAG: hypothetical protein DME04_08185 [Candidatus Rokuibacteriota bacterium]|nr:MAG: hypothetical protein DME04_08185 [Candidatus Rokubacteria bacterium]